MLPGHAPGAGGIDVPALSRGGQFTRYSLSVMVVSPAATERLFTSSSLESNGLHCFDVGSNIRKMIRGLSKAVTKFGLVCSMVNPKFLPLSNAWCQLTPLPFFRSPVTTPSVIESPSGLLKLSCTAAAVPISLPRTPGQHCPAVTVAGAQFPGDAIVPSTNIRNSAYWT